MSIDFREALRQRIAFKLRGDGQESGGIEATILFGYPKDYPTYQHMVGYHKAYVEFNELLDAVWRDLYAPPEPMPADQPVEQS